MRTIIDAGANIGLTSLWLRRRFPEATIVAIEADPENAAIATRNLAPYDIPLLQAALAADSRPRRILRGAYRDGAHWASQVIEASSGDRDTVSSVTLRDAARLLPLPTIDLLKVDIEGSEYALFTGDPTVLADVRTVFIELHDDAVEGCSAAFRAAAEPYGFAWTDVPLGGVTYATRG